MTTTTNLQILNLENGDVAKETKINGNMAIIDAVLPRALNDAASAPAVANLAPGSTYFNTTDSKVYYLHALTKNANGSVLTGSWIALN